VIVFGGLVEFVSRPAERVGALVVMAVGLLLLGSTLDVLPTSVWNLVWPLALIAVGGWLLMGRWRAPESHETGDTVEGAVAFGDRQWVVTARAFRGGAVTTLFGDATIDLRDAALAEDADLEIMTVFGDTVVHVPHGLRVVVRGPVIFGEVDDKLERGGEPDRGPVLTIRTSVLFGEVKLRSAQRTTREDA
jgi:hypothetical protein